MKVWMFPCRRAMVVSDRFEAPLRPDGTADWTLKTNMFPACATCTRRHLATAGTLDDPMRMTSRITCTGRQAVETLDATGAVVTGMGAQPAYVIHLIKRQRRRVFGRDGEHEYVTFRLYVDFYLAHAGTNSVLTMTADEFEDFKARLGAEVQ